MKSLTFVKSMLFLLLVSGISFAQVTDSGTDALSNSETVQTVKEKASEIGQALNQSEAAKEVSSSILAPIYDLAEMMSGTTFYWIAFAMMVAGVVSFAGQLVLAKFLLLFRFHLSIKEIMSDILGLGISAIGLVLTTQAATQNSTFSESPLMVISAAIVGVLAGVMFYIWGQNQEFRAAKGGKTAKVAKTQVQA